MKNEFVINGDNDINFIGNRESGKWVISDQPVPKIKNIISGKFADNTLEGVTSVVLNMGRSCNLDCKYCLVGDLKTETTPLSVETGRKVIEKVSEMQWEKKEIVFHGSEPMMNYGVMKDLVLYGNELDKSIKFCMQSNGSLFNEESLDFLLENNVGIGISIDGMPRHQSQTRPFKGGGNSYSDVVKNILKIKRRIGGVSVITVVTKANVHDLEEIANHFESLGINSVSFNPVNSPAGINMSPLPSDLTYNIQKVCDNYLHGLVSGNNPIRIENLKRFLGTLFLPKTTSSCIQCGAGPANPLLAIDIDGSIYPCDYFWGDERKRIGNISKISLNEAAASKKNFRNVRKVEEFNNCFSCNWKRFCAGGCAGSQTHLNNGSLKQSELGCEYSYSMLNYVAHKLPFIYKQGMVKNILTPIQE